MDLKLWSKIKIKNWSSHVVFIMSTSMRIERCTKLDLTKRWKKACILFLQLHKILQSIRTRPSLNYIHICVLLENIRENVSEISPWYNIDVGTQRFRCAHYSYTLPTLWLFTLININWKRKKNNPSYGFDLNPRKI